MTSTRIAACLRRTAALFTLCAALATTDTRAQTSTTDWLDPQVSYFQFTTEMPIEIGYRRTMPGASFMGVGWIIKNKTNEKVEFSMDQYYYCNGRLVQERKGSTMSIKPGATLTGGRFRGDDAILWDDFFFGGRPGDQLRKGEVIDDVRVGIRLKTTTNAAADRAAAREQAERDAAAARENERQLAERREQERQERLERQRERQQEAERRAELAERAERREAERQAQQRDRNQRIADEANSRIRRTQATANALSDAVGDLSRRLQERANQEREERAREREEERQEEERAERRREARERRLLERDS